MAEAVTVYRERAYLLALLATHYPSGIVHGADPHWPDYPVLFIQLPSGQATWHIAPEDTELFEHVRHGDDVWDGHDTRQKYARVMRETCARAHQQTRQ